MKILLLVSFFTIALCDLAPPRFQHGGFRPVPQRLSQNRPHASYGPPQQINHLDVRIPSKLTIEELIRLTERIQNSRPQKIQNSWTPERYPQFPLRPGTSQVPFNTYAPSNVEQTGSSNSQFRPPSTSYGVPDLRNIETLQKQQQSQPDSLRLPQKSPTGFRSAQPQQYPPQSYQAIGAQSGSNNVPQGAGQYFGSPQPQQYPRQSNQDIGAQSGSNNTPQGSGQYFGSSQPQHYPSQSNQDIGGQSGSNSTPQGSGQSFGSPQPQQYPSQSNQNIGAQSGSNNVPQVSGQYLPPTTPKTIDTTTTTLSPPSSTVTPKDFEYDYDSPSTTEEASLNEEGSDNDNPNISISNAVAGGTNFFYLQQPDGRLQKVVLQKMKEPNSKPEEYVANYYFQNIQALPNTLYTPLVSLGGVLKK